MIERVAAAVGEGLFAGMVGTAATTASGALEATLRDREGSTAPLDAAAKVLGFQLIGETEKARLSTMVHWAYGTLWGAPRGVLAVAGIAAPVATLLRLLRRIAQLLRPDGTVLGELAGPGVEWARVGHRVSVAFRWATVGLDGIEQFAGGAGFTVADVRSVADRHVATLQHHGRSTPAPGAP